MVLHTRNFLIVSQNGRTVLAEREPTPRHFVAHRRDITDPRRTGGQRCEGNLHTHGQVKYLSPNMDMASLLVWDGYLEIH